MTQQYIVGELSLLLAGLQPVSDASLAAAAGKLRHRVECGPLPMLPGLAREAMTLADAICWVALERGDVGGFRRSADTAAALRQFMANASLAP